MPVVSRAVKILLLKPSSLGDVIQALPVLRLLKQHLPESEVYWWIDTALAPLLDGDPDLAGLVLFHRRRWASPWKWPELWQSVRWVRKQRFDWVIDLQCLARSAWFAWLANGRLTVGLDEPREAARGFYDVVVRRASFHTHAADWYLGTLRALGIPVHQDFRWMRPQPAVAAELRQKWPANGWPWIIVQPGARWSNKRWPVDYFRELLQQIAADHAQLHFAILGTEQDRALGRVLAQSEPRRCLDLTGQTSLPEMVEWIRLGQLMITNDTGPMHVAAALGKPLIALFGPTEPRRTGPYGQIPEALQLDLDCAPCMKSRCHNREKLKCLTALTPAAVLVAVQKQLQRLERSTMRQIQASA